ncbi:TIGR01906 family membrane protein [uncultured Kocuria sp.]|uniref:TIGR01906 family membrane protein n=1 Tax=uncultured Kocuria sp. TaxID=259305 RepID=UPI0025969E45|nr:TIGR01906 family membrane protein [uncultured Kocuria sp.]MCT1366502.1 TIGR01906 family membrane protein [Rothia sp. p3-SID1597]
MSVPSRPDDHEAPWADSPRQEWDSLVPAVAPQERQQRDDRPRGGASVRNPAAEDVATAGATPSSDSGTTGRRSEAETNSRDGERGSRRVTAREDALEDRPKALGLRRCLMTVAVPLVTLMLGIRLVATPAFLWFEYHRPGFPTDSFGFTTDDRMTFGSYGLNYILNFAPSRYLGDVVTPRGETVFLPTEVQHMTDVKHVMLWSMLAVGVVALVALLSSMGLRRRAPGAIRKSLFLGAWITLVLLVVLAVLALLGWEAFFTTFHEIFFSGGNWAFRESDSLIRLYPETFWVDSAVVVAGVAVLISAILLILTWPTAGRRQRALKRIHERQELRDRLSA